MATNQYGQTYSGNDDFRGWLAAGNSAPVLFGNKFGESGDAYNKLLLQFAGNDGSISINDPELADYARYMYNTWSKQRNGGGYSTSNTYNAQLAAEQARQAQRANEAQGIKDRMMGRRGEFENILNETLDNIDKTYKEESSRRKETYDADSAELMNTLEQALPEIAASFAAIGGYDSSLRGYREMDAEKEHQNSQNELKREYESELGNLGAKANQARTEARTAYNNFMTDFDTLAGTEANSDNLENIRKSQNSLLKGINDFRGQSNIYKPNSTFSSEMKNLGGDYDFGNIRDAFTSFLNTTNAGSGGNFQADEKIAEEAKKTTNKVKNEIEQNKSTGVSK
jgi:hypothetical protein